MSWVYRRPPRTQKPRKPNPALFTSTAPPSGQTLNGVLFTNPPSFFIGSLYPKTTLFATGDATISNVVNENDATTNLYQSIDDSPLSPSDSDWINNDGVDTASAFFDLTDVPATFLTAQSATLIFRYRGQFWGSGTLKLYAQIFQSNESTSLSDEVEVVSVNSDTSFANTGSVTLTGLSAGSKAIWDGAKIRIRWGT